MGAVGPVVAQGDIGGEDVADDLATTEFRLGTNPSDGLINHNGSFESSGAPKEIKDGEGKWQFWVITFDGWMERVYLNGKQIKEKNNFLMVRPEGHITIGADGSGSNNFMGYINTIGIIPFALSSDEIEQVCITSATISTLPPSATTLRRLTPTASLSSRPT